MGKKSRRQRKRRCPEAGTLPLPPRTSCRNPSSCETCLLAYSPGCLHTIMEAERDSPEMNAAIDALAKTLEGERGLSLPEMIDYWMKKPENVAHVTNETMVRLLHALAIKLIIQKENSSIGAAWKELATALFACGIQFSFLAKLGEENTRAITEQRGLRVLPSLSLSHDENAALNSLVALPTINGYSGLVHVLDKFTPCDCLNQELRKQTKDDHRWTCCVCGKTEDDETAVFNLCSACNTCCYCSEECQSTHWKTENASWGRAHKKICPIVQECLSFGKTA